jgi:protein-ribulosamine 3-kinase
MTLIDPVIYQQLCLNLGVKTIRYEAVSGGSINKTFKLFTGNQTLFCKINSATKFPHLFQKEAAGLKVLGKYTPLKIPTVIDLIESKDSQILLLEWIEPTTPTRAFWKRFGEGLAALHTHTQPLFGLDTDNYMGSVLQKNSPTPDWPTFFIQNRLEPLIQQCHTQLLLNANQVALFQNLYPHIPAIFDEHPPALLHGDLWSGNFMCTSDNQPVLIDPATYYGHRSIDLGMTTLFGGFESIFYETYRYHAPFPSNYKEQWSVCNLYPLLIHLLLFGRSYLPSIERTLNDFQ